MEHNNLYILVCLFIRLLRLDNCSCIVLPTYLPTYIHVLVEYEQKSRAKMYKLLCFILWRTKVRSTNTNRQYNIDKPLIYKNFDSFSFHQDYETGNVQVIICF